MTRYTKFQSKLSTLFLFVLVGLGSFGSLVPKAAAVDFYIYVYSPARGENAWDCNGNATLDKATYAPGDTATLSGSGSLRSDTAATGTGGCSVAYWRNPANTTAAFDLEVTGSLMSIGGVSNIRAVDAPDSFSGQTSFTIPPTLTPGSHTIKVYASVGGGCRVNSGFPTCTGARDAVLSIPFTVVNPASAGTIAVAANLAEASYTITGPVTIPGTGASNSYTTQPTGTYTITWGAVAGYTTPTPSSLTLAAGRTINFSGNYVAQTTGCGGANYTMNWVPSPGYPTLDATTIWFMVGTDKCTYAPGESITLDIGMSSDDFPIGTIFSPFLTARPEGGSSSGDLISGTYSKGDLTGATYLSGLTHANLKAPMTTGPFNLTVGAGVGSNARNGAYRNQSPKNIPLSVSTSSGPTIDVHF